MANPSKVKVIRHETREFIALYHQLRGRAFTGNIALAKALNFNSPSSITEIIKSRQNIDIEKLKLFKELYKDYMMVRELPLNAEPASNTHITTILPVEAPINAKSNHGIPMYEIPANGMEAYKQPNKIEVLGYMNFPGIEDCDFALPVYGNAMYPTLENGCWVALKVIQDRKILPGEVYYVEWGEYRMFKRLLAGDNDCEVIAHSDNSNELIGDQLKHQPFTIKLNDVKMLCLVKNVLKRHNN
jgi:hypothetical protein